MYMYIDLIANSTVQHIVLFFITHHLIYGLKTHLWNSSRENSSESRNVASRQHIFGSRLKNVVENNAKNAKEEKTKNVSGLLFGHFVHVNERF